jgi:hypothetical protein
VTDAPDKLEQVRRSLAQLAGERSIPKAGLLATTGMVHARRACQLLVE